MDLTSILLRIHDSTYQDCKTSNERCCQIGIAAIAIKSCGAVVHEIR
jgi:hypothetical protein